MNSLSVFNSIYGENAEMTFDKALLISLVGFLTVFLILGLLAIFVKLMGKGFDTAGRESNISVTDFNKSTPRVPEFPLPENQSAGQLVLENVTEEEAAVIMAVVSDKSGIPLNRLQFNSIKLREGEK